MGIQMVFNSFDMMSIVYIYTVNYDMDYCTVHSAFTVFFCSSALLCFWRNQFFMVFPFPNSYSIRSYLYFHCKIPYIFIIFDFSISTVFSVQPLRHKNRHFSAPITNISSFINRFVKCKIKTKM